MGSLPNLTDICRENRRTNQKVIDLARERARQSEFNRNEEHESKDHRLKKKTLIQNVKQIMQTQTQTIKQTSARQQQHRHSLTGRKVHRTNSSGASHHIWDDHMIEHMTAYSPISSHRHRVNTAPPYQISATLNQNLTLTPPNTTGTISGHIITSNKRKDSVNSSIGATSIRRLLAVNRGCRHKVPVHVRAKVAKNFILLIVSHGLTCGVLLPFFGLQASNSIWFHQETWLLRLIGPNVGPLLISICCFITSGMCLLTNRIIRKIDFITIIAIHYVILCLFLLAHLYPVVWVLLPVYILFGASLGPAWICKWNLVVFFASRISCGLHECSNLPTHQTEVNSNTLNTSANAISDDIKGFCNRSQRIRRLARCFHAIQDIGICLGSLIASIIISCAAIDSNCFLRNNFLNFNVVNNSSHNYQINLKNISTTTVYSQRTLPYDSNQNAFDSLHTFSTIHYDNINEDSIFDQQDELQDSLFNRNEHGIRICGIGSCPIWNEKIYSTNNTIEYDWFTYNGTIPMTIFYLLLTIIALILTCLSQHVDNTMKNENYKGIRDTLIFAGPMAYFVGTEQAYVLGGFTRTFVSCTLGAQMVAGALVGMGLMQCIVSCTLSMLLRHTKRIAVLAAAFFFHACLLLVLSSWKPSIDDSALFYVIAAAWGACNGIWETLLFALITLTHSNHMIEIASPLQALRFFGGGITFIAHTFLCENTKILILFVMLVISVVPYTVHEVRMESQRKNHSNNI